MNAFFQQFVASLGTYLPGALAALGILVGGWIVALLAAAITRGILARTNVDRWLTSAAPSGEEAPTFSLTRWVSRIVYYVVLLFVAIGVLQALSLSIVADPIQQLLNQALLYVPQILDAAALLLAAWIIGSSLRFLIGRVLRISRFDERLSESKTPHELQVGCKLDCSRLVPKWSHALYRAQSDLGSLVLVDIHGGRGLFSSAGPTRVGL